MEFKVEGNKFYKDGREIKIISGAVHYFRNLPDTWRDIFKKLRALGCNCVESYCAWNMHEKEEGVFDFTGGLDIAKFIKTAQEEGLMVIIRPGPYICAEWEFGGLPWWLQKYDDMEIRCENEQYIKFFDRYLDRIFDEIRPLLCTNGGPVIMVQCENEYGYYGDDKGYLDYLYNGYRKRNIDVPLFTSDGTAKSNLADGTIDGCLATLNFGSKVEQNFSAHNELFPNMPKMCMEMWNGWFDSWEDECHHTTSASDYAATVDDMLKIGSLNMYMFIGGTNFGFMNGANHYEKYTPDVTSYDYDALLTECGDITEKYMAVRKVIQKYCTEPLPQIPQNRKKSAYGKVTDFAVSGIFDNLQKLSKGIETKVPKCMEWYNQGYGYIAYQTVLCRDYDNVSLSFESIGDRAQIYVNRQLVGIVYINESLEIKFSAKSGDTLTVLCENMGRANFGSKMMRKKGIVGRCLIDGKIHFNWTAYPLPMDNLEKIEYGKVMPTEKSVFLKGSFNVDEACDTFLRLCDFTKGFVRINGFNIGRYWDKGPQKTLYVPSSLLKVGENSIEIFESDGLKAEPTALFCDRPDLG